MSWNVRRMQQGDFSEVANLIYDSLNVWYKENRGITFLTGPKSDMLVFPRVYEALDPGCTILVEEVESGRIAGSCFFHQRPTHVSLGILTVHPDFFGQKVGAELVRAVIQIADDSHLPLRLVSSALNFDSFNLYNRYGFRPTIFFQDMSVEVPENGFSVPVPSGRILREASLDDLPAMVALERELYSIEREKDFRFFIENKEGIWRTTLLCKESTGELEGFVSSVLDPGSNMIGPGISRTESGMAALIRHQLNYYPGRRPVWLIPSDAIELRDSMFEIGARNCELHIGQVRGDYLPATGVVLPSFMPETS